MPKLTITTDQEGAIVAMETDLEEAFSLGVMDDTFQDVFPAMEYYNTPDVQAVKDRVKNPFKSLIAAMMVALNIKRTLPNGLSTTVILAKITSGGSNGSLTFVDGLLTAKVDPS